MLNKVALKVVMMTSVAATLVACNKSADSFSILADADDFKQEAVLTVKKIDVLWVVDNSGSMQTSQDNLASSFQSFINKFDQKGYDFHMAVTTTEAWEKQFNSNSSKARIKDGAKLSASVTTSSGYYVMDKNTPNLSNVFSINIKQGTLGNGDERALESMKQALLEPWNSSFRRSDAFLAVIIVSDEEDFSHSSSSFNESYSNPGLYTVQSYADFLSTYTGGTANGKNFSVSTISVPNQACVNQLSTDGFQRKISTRLPELSSLTGGVTGSLCTNFGDTLELISNNIAELSAVFKLSREPLVETIKITVDGVVIANDPVNGWTYDPSNLTITFNGDSIPGASSSIKIDYYPASVVQ